jgi:hypothetical protein
MIETSESTMGSTLKRSDTLDSLYSFICAGVDESSSPTTAVNDMDGKRLSYHAPSIATTCAEPAEVWDWANTPSLKVKNVHSLQISIAKLTKDLEELLDLEELETPVTNTPYSSHFLPAQPQAKPKTVSMVQARVGNSFGRIPQRQRSGSVPNIQRPPMSQKYSNVGSTRRPSAHAQKPTGLEQKGELGIKSNARRTMGPVDFWHTHQDHNFATAMADGRKSFNEKSIPIRKVHSHLAAVPARRESLHPVAKPNQKFLEPQVWYPETISPDRLRKSFDVAVFSKQAEEFNIMSDGEEMQPKKRGNRISRYINRFFNIK